jgi:hypothetical protein
VILNSAPPMVIYDLIDELGYINSMPSSYQK